MKSKRFRQLLVGCGGLLLIVCLVVAIVAYRSRDRIRQVSQMFALILENPDFATVGDLETFEELLVAERENVAIVSYAVSADGTPDLSQPAIFHYADRPMPLASTVKISILAAYADAVASGDLDPAERVTLAEWERYHLPGVNGGAHIAALGNLNIAHNADGFAVDSSATVSLDDLAHAMIRYSDNAAPDYFVGRLGADRIKRVSGQTEIVPHSGFVLSVQNQEVPEPSAETLDPLLAMPSDEYLALTRDYQTRYLTTEWGDEARIFMANNPPIRDFIVEATAANELTTLGTAGDYARMMAGVATGTFISPEVSAIMARFLEWPMEFEGNQAEFDAFGTKGGSLLTVITEASYIRPKGADQPRVVVTFMRDMPFSAWLSISQTFVHQEFAVELATNPEYAAGFVGRWEQ